MSSHYVVPLRPLTPEWARTPEKLAHWLEENAPSFAGNIPAKYTDSLFREFQRNLVAKPIIRGALVILAKKGIRFDYPPGWDKEYPSWEVMPVVHASDPAGHVQPAPQMKGISTEEWDRTVRFTFEEYERRYVLAIRTNNVSEMEVILVAVLKLLIAAAKAHGKAKQMQNNPKNAEWIEFDEHVTEALSRARTLQTHIRQLSPQELRELRNSAGPPVALDLHLARITRQLTVRTVPNVRRAARR